LVATSFITLQKNGTPTTFILLSVGQKYQQVSLNREKLLVGKVVAAFISAKFLSGVWQRENFANLFRLLTMHTDVLKMDFTTQNAQCYSNR